MIFGSLIMVQGPWIPPRSLAYEYPDTEEYAFILTDESPSFQVNVTRHIVKATITDVNTNGTPVNIFAFDDDRGTILNISDVSKIVDDGIVIDGGNRIITLIFFIQDANVEVSFKLISWYYVVLDVFYVMPPPYFLYGAALFIIGIFLILKVERNCKGPQGQKRWRRREGPLAIIVLISVSAMLAMPLIYGSTHGSFESRGLTETTTHDFTYNLTDSSPEITVDLMDYIHGYSSVFRIKVVEFRTEEPVRIRTREDQRFLIVLGSVTSFNDFRIEISIMEESSHFIEIRKIDSDTSVSFNVVVERSYRGLRNDPAVPILLAFFAVAPASIALYQARAISQRLNLRETQHVANQRQ